MNKRKLLEHLIENACVHYFTEIDPKTIRIKITHNYKWKGIRRIAGVWTWKPLTIQFDGEWLENANIFSILEVILHEMMHIRLRIQKKQQPKTVAEEQKLERNVKEIIETFRKNNKELVQRLGGVIRA